MFMMSSGGLTSADLFAGKDAILSGPAGGVVAMARTGKSAGFDRVIGFDMGGTSTDVAHFDGEYERAFETEVAGVRMRAPMMSIHTVAAGGGSILHFDGARFRVGPDSAGADPGPRCYRRGGPLAVTDANLMTGKLIPDFFPKIFGPGQDQPLDADAVREAFAALAREVGDGRTPEQVADGFIAIAVAKMAEAIKKISVARGYDVTRYALNCFGGAGGQHACDVADQTRDRDGADPSAVVAAFGLWHGPRRHRRASRPGRRRARSSAETLKRLARPGRRSSATEAVDGGRGAGRRAPPTSSRARARNCATPAPTPRWRSISPTRPKMRRAFESAHKARFGFIDRAKTDRRRGGQRRGDRRRGALRRARARARDRRARRGRSAPTRFYSNGAWREAQRLPARGAAARRARRRPRAHHRAASDHRRRGRLARGDHAEEPRACCGA